MAGLDLWIDQIAQNLQVTAIAGRTQNSPYTLKRLLPDDSQPVLIYSPRKQGLFDFKFVLPGRYRFTQGYCESLRRKSLVNFEYACNCLKWRGTACESLGDLLQRVVSQYRSLEPEESLRVRVTFNPEMIFVDHEEQDTQILNCVTDYFRSNIGLRVAPGSRVLRGFTVSTFLRNREAAEAAAACNSLAAIRGIGYWRIPGFLHFEGRMLNSSDSVFWRSLAEKYGVFDGLILFSRVGYSSDHQRSCLVYNTLTDSCFKNPLNDRIGTHSCSGTVHLVRNDTWRISSNSMQRCP